MKDFKKSKFITMALALTLSTTALVSANTYQYGDQGANVSKIQKQLIKQGYHATDKTGVYGKETKWAVRLFQKDHGLPVDGIAGPETLKKLGVSTTGAPVAHAVTRSNNGGVIMSKANVNAILAEAGKYKGVPYVFGGTTPSGFDCSGYTRFVFAKAGINLPRLADEQYMMGKSVSKANLQPGDLVFFETYEPGASHSGIYIGNGQFISATSSRGVAVASLMGGYWGERYLGAKRVM